MMKTNKKYGWQVKGILGMIFAGTGLFHILLGVFLWQYDAGDTREETMILLYVFSGVGAVFLLIGLVLLLFDLKRRRSQRRAYESGRYVMAVITGLLKIQNVQMNNRHPWAAECTFRHPDTGMEQICKSRYLYSAPQEQLIGKEVPVYQDPMTDQYVFMDIDTALD